MNRLPKLIQANPITFKPLWENTWVFTVYGICLALSIKMLEVLNLNLSKSQSLMMEPLSFYAFSILSLVGLLALGFTNLFLARTPPEMHKSAWVRRFWVPIASTGLTTGAIIMGMMLGLGLGFTPWIHSDPQISSFIKLLFAMAVFILTLLVPLTLMMRSMFDLTKQEECLSVILGIIYCFVLGIIYWIVDQERFWSLLTSTVIACLIFSFFIRHLSKRGAK